MSKSRPTGVSVAIAGPALLLLAATSIAADSSAEVLEGTWAELALAPFGSQFAAGAWTGDKLLTVDVPSGRAATYLVESDAWAELPQGDSGFNELSPWAWSGTELFVFDGSTGEGQSLDPDAGIWRALARSPLIEPRFATWADGRIVVGDANGNAAVYETTTDSWAELPHVPGAKLLGGLYWTGSEVLGLTVPKNQGKAQVATLDLDSRAWGEPSKGPVVGFYADPLWTGSELLFASGRPNEPDLVTSASFDPSEPAWTELDLHCPARTTTGVISGGFLMDVLTGDALNPMPGFALDLVDRTCLELADDGTRAAFIQMRTPALVIDVDGVTVLWSGAGGDLTTPPDARGISFTPMPAA